MDKKDNKVLLNTKINKTIRDEFYRVASEQNEFKGVALEKAMKLWIEQNKNKKEQGE